MSQWDFGMPPGGQAAGGYDEYGEYHDNGAYGAYDEYGEEIYRPITYERDTYPTAPLTPMAAPAPPPPTAPRPGVAGRGPALGRELDPSWPGESWPPRLPRRERRRWLVPALTVAAAAAVGATMLLAGASPASPASATRSVAPPQPGQPAPRAAAPRTAAPPPGMRPPLTMTQAQQVLAAYTTANNQANARRSDTVLATVETGSSYAIDAGIYRVQQAENAAPYPAFAPRRALYYIPWQPAAYPHWFAVQVLNANLASPGTVTGTEYLVFTQAAAGAPWKNAIEPYLVAGASAPRVAIGADGFATAVGTGAASLAVPPARIGQLTAASLDGSGPVGVPANLTDRLDQAFWRSKIPAASVTDQHAPGPGGQVFGLATTGGGALLFYAGTAELTLAPPRGEVIHLSIPGFYSPGQALSRAGVGYLEQFAAYVPPRGDPGPRVVADYSGITSRN